MALAVDAVSNTSGSGTGPFTFSHTVSGSDRALCVCIANYRNTTYITDVTFDGDALTELESLTSGEYTVSIWGMAAPNAGTLTVSVTPNLSVFDIGISAISFTGVDQVTPFGTAGSASGTSDAPSVAVSSASGELVLDSLLIVHSGTLTVGSGQTQRVKTNTGNAFIKYACSTEPGASSTTMSWSNSTSQDWAIAAVPVKPVSGGGGSFQAAWAVGSNILLLGAA